MHLKNRNLSSGYHNLVNRTNVKKALFMNLDLDLWIANENELKEFQVSTNEEKVFLILTGEADLEFDNQIKSFKRNNLFEESGAILHLKQNQSVKIFIKKATEFLIVTTQNNQLKQNYVDSTTNQALFGKDIWENVAKRKIRTYFDFKSRPDSNLVIGEVITYQGKWSSYLPHHHPQPELYFFKQEKKSGFAISVNGKNAYIVETNDVNAIPGGLIHPVSSAPGYPLYYCWIVRHLTNNPWVERIEEEKHLWLKDPNAKYWKEKNEN